MSKGNKCARPHISHTHHHINTYLSSVLANLLSKREKRKKEKECFVVFAYFSNTNNPPWPYLSYQQFNNQLSKNVFSLFLSLIQLQTLGWFSNSWLICTHSYLVAEFHAHNQQSVVCNKKSSKKA